MRGPQPSGFGVKETMNKKEAATALGISLRSLERRMRSGRVKFTKSESQFGEVSFTYADLGLLEPETRPLAAQLAVVSSPDPPAVDTTAPETSTDADLENWSSEDLEKGRVQWMKPDRPNGGVLTNAPAYGSSNLPNPKSYAKLIRANAILYERSLRGTTLPRQPRRTAYSVPRF